MSAEKMREEFESAYTKRLRDAGFESVIEFRRHEDGYANLFTDGAWWGWQASRAAIEVELPNECGANVGKSWSTAFNSARLQCVKAIESLGLKVRP